MKKLLHMKFWLFQLLQHPVFYLQTFLYDEKWLAESFPMKGKGFFLMFDKNLRIVKPLNLRFLWDQDPPCFAIFEPLKLLSLTNKKPQHKFLQLYGAPQL